MEGTGVYRDRPKRFGGAILLIMSITMFVLLF